MNKIAASSNYSLKRNSKTKKYELAFHNNLTAKDLAVIQELNDLKIHKNYSFLINAIDIVAIDVVGIQLIHFLIKEIQHLNVPIFYNAPFDPGVCKLLFDCGFYSLTVSI